MSMPMLTPGNYPLRPPPPPELYKDCRLGKYDIVVWGRASGEVKIGRIEKLSKVTKRRSDDGSNVDQRGDPHFYYVYPKFHPDESVFKIRPIELKICDRYLKIGFIVKEFETGRVGYVQGIKQQLTVKLIGYDLILRDLETRDLIDPWKLNVQFKRPVFYRGWVGRIGCPVQRRVCLRFIDRKIRAFSFSIAWNELAHILVENGVIKMGTFSFESSGFAFWPGKKYKIPKKTLFSNKYKVSWEGDLRPQCTAADHLITIRIYKTEVMPFRVQWIRAIPGAEVDAGLEPGTELERPKEIFTEEDIKDLTFIRPIMNSCLGDVRMYRVKAEDYRNFITDETWKMILRRRYWLPRPRAALPTTYSTTNRGQNDDEEATLSPLELNEEVAVEVIYARSTAEVAWVDGKISRIDSSKLCRVKSDYFEVGSFVEPITLPGVNTFGVIQQVKVFGEKKKDKPSVDKLSVIMDNSAIVKWFYFGNDEEPEEQTYETELPLKLLRAHSKFNFKSKSCMNVIVCRASGDGCQGDFTAGFVVNTYPDGKLRVRCVDGSVRRFWPFEIIRITPVDNVGREGGVGGRGGGEGEDKSITSRGSSSAASTVSSISQNSLPMTMDSSRNFSDDGAGAASAQSLNAGAWRQAIKQVSIRNLSWRDKMALQLREQQAQHYDRFTSHTQLHHSLSKSSARS